MRLSSNRAPGIRLGCLQGLIASPCTLAPGGTGWRGRSRGTQGGVGSKNVAKCFENLPAFLRKDFRNLLPRFARGGTTIARHCDFLSPLDPFLGSLAYRRVSLVTARFLCGFMPLYPWHAVRGKVSCSVFRRQALCCPQPLRHACRGGWFAATAACPLGPSGPSGPSYKVFRDQTCASAFDRAPGIRLGLFAGAYRQPLHPGARWHREAG